MGTAINKQHGTFPIIHIVRKVQRNYKNIELFLHHSQAGHFGLRNGLFQPAKRTFWRSKTDRFRTPKGMY
mgnify:FL=1